MRVAVADRGDAGVGDALRSVEIRLADLEVDDVLPLRLERARLREDLERGLGTESLHAGRERTHRRK